MAGDALTLVPSFEEGVPCASTVGGVARCLAGIGVDRPGTAAERGGVGSAPWQKDGRGRILSSTMKSTLKSLLLVILAAGIMTLVGTGCQTTKGLGRDIEHVGEKIQGD